MLLCQAYSLFNKKIHLKNLINLVITIFNYVQLYLKIITLQALNKTKCANKIKLLDNNNLNLIMTNKI